MSISKDIKMYQDKSKSVTFQKCDMMAKNLEECPESLNSIWAEKEDTSEETQICNSPVSSEMKKRIN